MSSTITAQPAAGSQSAGQRPGSAPRPARRALAVLVGLAGAWLIPVAAHAVGVDWILPLLVWFGVASLLRSGRTALDRLVLALGMLVGATCAAGLLLSVWPWRMQPVAVSGAALSGLVLLAAALRRRPSLPRAVRVADLVIAVGTLGIAALTVFPFRGQSFGGRLAILAGGDDLARHYMIYDTIRVVDGYLFQHRGTALPYLDPGYEVYPQGIHFIYALLANFMPQGRDPNDAIASFDLLLTFDIATFVFLSLAVLWGLRWVAGPLLTGWLSLPVLAGVGALCFFGPPISMLTRGFPSEAAGAALVALLVAVLARPLHRTSEQLVLVGSLLVAVSFTYFLFLPFCCGATLVWLWLYRRRLRWVTTLVTAVVTAVLLALIPVLNVLWNKAGPGERLLLGGAISQVPRNLALGVVLVVGAGVLVGAARRSPVWRACGIFLLGAAANALGLLGYQLATIGESSYYFEKYLHQLLIVSMVSSGAVVLLVKQPAPAAAGPVPPRWSWAGPFVRLAGLPMRHLRASLATLLAIAAAVAVGAVGTGNLEDLSDGRKHLQRINASWVAGRDTEQAVKLYPRSEGRITLVQMDGPLRTGKRYGTHWASVYTASMQRAYPAYKWTYWWDAPWEPNSELDVAEYLMTSHNKFRVLVNDTDTYNMLTDIKARYPQLDLEIVDLRKPRSATR